MGLAGGLRPNRSAYATNQEVQRAFELMATDF